jgi:hypothetical protein
VPAEQREVGGGADRAGAVSGFDADNQDADDLECIVAVPCHANLRAAHVGYVHNRAGAGIFLLGINDPDGGLRVAGEHSNEALDLSLGVADEASADNLLSSSGFDQFPFSRSCRAMRASGSLR